MVLGQEQIQYLKGIVENESEGFPWKAYTYQLMCLHNHDKKELDSNMSMTPSLFIFGIQISKVAAQDMLKFENSGSNHTTGLCARRNYIASPIDRLFDIDVKNVPINSAGRYRIPGLQGAGYDGGDRNPNAIAKTFASIFNPADFLHNLFGKKGVQMQKLKKMRENDELKNLLASKFDREIIIQLLNLNRLDLDEILRNCNYSDTFLKESNDLQILEAIVAVMRNIVFYNCKNTLTTKVIQFFS